VRAPVIPPVSFVYMVFAVEGSDVVRVLLQYVAVGVICVLSSIVIEKRPNMRTPTKTCTRGGGGGHTRECVCMFGAREG